MERNQKMYVSFELNGKRYATLCDCHGEALELKGFLLFTDARYIRINRSGRLKTGTRILKKEQSMSLAHAHAVIY